MATQFAITTTNHSASRSYEMTSDEMRSGDMRILISSYERSKIVARVQFTIRLIGSTDSLDSRGSR